MYRSVGFVAACALGASALILPPGIAPANSDDDGSLPSIVNPKNQLIQLPCPACAFSSKSQSSANTKHFDDLFWIQGDANDILVNFTISDDGQALQLNGKSIYAPTLHRTALISSEPLYVHQVPASASEFEIESGKAKKVPLEITSVGLSTEAEVRASPEGDVIVQLQLNIMGIEGVFMQFDGVRIHLLKSKAGEFLILRLDVVPNEVFSPFPGLPESAPSPPPDMRMPEMKECQMLPTSLCKFRNMIEAKIDDMRHGPPQPPPVGFHHPPPHDLPPHINPHNLDLPPPPPSSRQGKPHHMRPHGGYRHRHGHRGHHGYPSFTRSVISILIPVVAGITVGLFVSLMGLLAGRLVGYCWLRLFPSKRRSSRRSRRSRRAEEGRIALPREIKEPLPPYEDAPAYEDAPPYEEVVESRPN